jgi:hypothetical protein
LARQQIVYADALKILGAEDSKPLVVIDRLLGGMILGAAAVTWHPELLVLLHARDELLKQTKRLLSNFGQRTRGAKGKTRTELLIAAHAVIAVNAYFEALRDLDLPLDLTRLELTRADQLEVSGVPLEERSRSLVEVMLGTSLPRPTAHRPPEQVVDELKVWYVTLSQRFVELVRDLAPWDELNETQQFKLYDLLLREAPLRATAHYEDSFRSLSVDSREFSEWMGFTNHAASRAQLRLLGDDIKSGLDDLHRQIGHLRGDGFGSSLGRLRELSDAAIAEYDVVTLGETYATIRFSHGAYVPRTIEEKVLEHITRPCVTAIVGEAGHGKTAVLWHLYQTLLSAGRHPLLIPASALLADPGSMPRLTVQIIDEALQEAQDEGTRIVVLLDTLDLLLHDSDSRVQVNRLLSIAFRARVPTVVTCRPVEAQWLEISYEEPLGYEGKIRGITLGGYSRKERETAIAAYASLFYPATLVADVVRIMKNASLRGLPVQEVCSNPLALRLLFELYAPDEVPPEDIDTIGLYDQYWQKRVEGDERGPYDPSTGRDLSYYAEAAAMSLLADGNIEAERQRLTEQVRVIVSGNGRTVADALTTLHARGVFTIPPDSKRQRFFHQTFFEYAAARAIAHAGQHSANALMERVAEDPLDLFYGEAATQALLLADRGVLLPAVFATDILSGWLASDEPSLRALALRTYARMPAPQDRLRQQAADTLANDSLDAIKGYLTLLPSVSHTTFARAYHELALLWRRANALQQLDETNQEGRQLSLSVLASLARMATAHPEEAVHFIANHHCLEWLADLPVHEWRNHDSIYLRLLESVWQDEPIWTAVNLARFFEPLAQSGSVAGMADILGLMNRIAERYALPKEVLTRIVDAVRSVRTEINAAKMEKQYADLRTEMLMELSPVELTQRTRTILEDPAWSPTGRRAELRALTGAACRLDREAASAYMNDLLTVQDHTRQEHVCIVIGEALIESPSEPSPLTTYIRKLSKVALTRLPLSQQRGEARPLESLFVNALYSARVGTEALLAALPDQVPEGLWLDENGLLPLLVPSTLAGHPGATHALEQFLSEADSAAHTRGGRRKAVLGRLQENAVAGSRAAFDALIKYTAATGNITDLGGVLRKLSVSDIQILSEFHERLCRLRLLMVNSNDRGKVRDGYVLWRLLLERGVDLAPTPEQLARELEDSPANPMAITLLETVIACVSSTEWVGLDTAVLTDPLHKRIELGYERRNRLRQAVQIGEVGSERDMATEMAVAQEALARKALIASIALHGTLPSDPLRCRTFTQELFALAWDANYNLNVKSDLAAFTACLTELGRLLERLDDDATVVDLLLDSARRLNRMQPNATRWRYRVAHAWKGAITTTVVRTSSRQRKLLVTELLSTDQEMARLAIEACVDHIRPIPMWLRDLQPNMRPQTRERLRAAMRRQSREGSTRGLPELSQARIIIPDL